MSVTPLTLQMTVPMTNDVATVQNNENSRANIQNMQSAVASEKQAQIKNDTVIPKDTLEFTNYRYDARNKGNNEYAGDGGKDRKKAKKSPDAEIKMENEESKEKKRHIVQIDIKL